MSQETASFTSIEVQQVQEANNDWQTYWGKNTFPEKYPQAEAWLGTIQELLKKPQAVQRQPVRLKDKEYAKWFAKNQKVPVSEQYLAFEDKDNQRSIVVSSFADFNGQVRETSIQIAYPADTQDVEKSYRGIPITLKTIRTQSIRIVHDDQGRILWIAGGDSDKENWREKPHREATKEGWYHGALATKVGDNLMTSEEAKTLMEDTLQHLQKATVDKNLTKQIRDYQEWWDRYGYETFRFFNITYPLDKKEDIEKGWKRIQSLKRQEPQPKPRKETNTSVEKRLPAQAKQAKQSTPYSRGVIPLYILKDKVFSYVYEQIKIEVTQYGKKQMTDQEIDTYVKDMYELKKADLIKSGKGK